MVTNTFARYQVWDSCIREVSRFHRCSGPRFSVRHWHEHCDLLRSQQCGSFTDHDTAETPLVVVVNESIARRVFAGEDPIGKRLTVWPDEKVPREIIGVVGDVKSERLDAETGYQIYVPHTQDAGWGTPLARGANQI
jgi:hypothetical protein